MFAPIHVTIGVTYYPPKPFIHEHATKRYKDAQRETMLGRKARRIKYLELKLEDAERESKHWWEVAAGHKKEARLYDDLCDLGKLKRLQESNDNLVGQIVALQKELWREKFRAMGLSAEFEAHIVWTTLAVRNNGG